MQEEQAVPLVDCRNSTTFQGNQEEQVAQTVPCWNSSTLLRDSPFQLKTLSIEIPDDNLDVRALQYVNYVW